VDHQPTCLDVEASSAASTASWRRSRYVASSAARVNDQVCRETLPPHDAGLRLFERDRGRLPAPPPEQLQNRGEPRERGSRDAPKRIRTSTH
jgi:hypothetical protein